MNTDEETTEIFMIDNAGRLLRKGEHIGDLVDDDLRLLPDGKKYASPVTKWLRKRKDEAEGIPAKPALLKVVKKLTPAQQAAADQQGIESEASAEAAKSRAAYQDDLAFAESTGCPTPPKKNPQFGDKTPAYVDWLAKYRKDVFDARFGVKGRGKVPILKTNPDTGMDEVTGYRDADFATRKTHLTEKVETNRDLAEDMDWNA
ncbi:hypothetical protein HQ447_16350 [bacterium]|nr:hypothetical protein [bacterium]